MARGLSASLKRLARWIYQPMIEETARHAGHADIGLAPTWRAASLPPRLASVRHHLLKLLPPIHPGAVGVDLER